MKEVTNFLPNCPTVCSLYETIWDVKKNGSSFKNNATVLRNCLHDKQVMCSISVFVARNRGWQSDGGCPVESSSRRWNFGEFNNVSNFFFENHVQQLKVFKIQMLI